MGFTAAQLEAIAARGNVLVVAGAGTGKTRTLVARCLNCLIGERPPASLEEILMVTFTDAAAAEMRQRIRAHLEEKLAAGSDISRWSEQLALFETAHIGTLHGFCLQLVRQHFYELELDPQLAVMAEEEAKLLADETLETIFEAHYAGGTANATLVQQLIQTQARGWSLPIRQLVLKLHHYTQTLRDPEAWFASQLATYQSKEPNQWRLWLVAGVSDWRNRWLPALRSESLENKKAEECALILQRLSVQPSREECAEVLKQVRLADGNWPTGKIQVWRQPFKSFFSETTFLQSLARTDDDSDPLMQDWNWVRGQMTTLLELAHEFTTEFNRQKRELGAVDFHDLEQHAIKLLWDRTTRRPTAIAQQWRQKLRFVFVDEYQDINEAQDAILEALSREDAMANRFLVGDVKQSIYRFRLADPRIFQNYIGTWGKGKGRVIPLVDNFRSREILLNFVNSLFGTLMRQEIGGVSYGEEAELRFGDPENRAALDATHNGSPRVELHLRLRSTGENNAAESETDFAHAWTEVMNLEEAAKEARLTALRLRELQSSGHSIWDELTRSLRPVEWGDMAVLLRSPSGKLESYAREFTRLGVPLKIARGGFYESLEVTDLLSLLQLLDNPLQDLPVLAVLRSPLVGLSVDEMAAIRIKHNKGHFWIALQRYHEASQAHSGWTKVNRFLKNFAAWRRLVRQSSLSRCLEAVLDETHYAAWLLIQPRGEQRHANVQRLLSLAQQFDKFQRQGLFRFLRFIEAQQAAETEPQTPALSGANSVSLMSIHQSKGLEFPVVVVGDLGKPFNFSDLRAEIILDPQYGLCPQIKPPHTGQRYPSLPYWLARQRQKQEVLGEEMRLLYVAMTRARDTLILTGQISEKKFHNQWNETTEITTASLLTAGNYLDWIAAWSIQTAEMHIGPLSGENHWWRWKIYDDLDKRLLDDAAESKSEKELQEAAIMLDAASWRRLEKNVAWQYPQFSATHELAKTSVSALRQKLLTDPDTVSRPLFNFQSKKREPVAGSSLNSGKLSAVQIGTAHHTFLQLMALKHAGTLMGLKEEARRLERERAMSADELAVLDFDALSWFWQSDLGKNTLVHATYVRRELPFTARFSPAELPGRRDPELNSTEFVVVQGVADLAVLLPEEIWLVDFKTDFFSSAELADRLPPYESQLQLYAMALSRIYRRPVRQIYIHFLTLKRSVRVMEN